MADARPPVAGQGPEHPDLRIAESEMGRILVKDEAAGHEFEFRIETARGTQKLEAFAPRWAGGQEPTSAKRYVIEAHDIAAQEAVDQGWLGT